MGEQTKQTDVVAAETSQVGNIISVIERAAKDPNIDVQKMEKLLDMQERILAKQAEHEFWAAFAEMQTELPVITERGEIRHNGKLISKYARYDEDLHPVIMPILSKHGFSLLHQNVSTDTKSVTIKSTLSHRAGHQEDTAFPLEADTSGSKNGPQAVASSRSYAKRYNTCDLLNIATSGQDDDGNAAGTKTVSEEQAADLDSLVSECGFNKKTVLEHYKLKSWADLPASNFDTVCREIRAKHKARRGKKK